MNKLTRKTLLSLALAAGIANTAFAADISNINGQSCDGRGTWHFVNNRTGGAAAGFLSATWSSGDTCGVNPTKVNATTQHFYCYGSGELLSASTNLPGKLVLSDFTCDTKKDPLPK